MCHLHDDAVLGNAEHGGELLLEAAGPLHPEVDGDLLLLLDGDGQRDVRLPEEGLLAAQPASLVTLSALFSRLVHREWSSVLRAAAPMSGLSVEMTPIILLT